MKKVMTGMGKRGLIASAALILSLGLASCGLLSEPTLNTTLDTSTPITTASDDDDMTTGTSAGSMDETSDVSDTSVAGDLELTLDELAAFDGKDGQPAYVAVDGVIYDVSHLDLWAGGEHQDQHSAGQDLTKAIDEESPHGRSMLERATVVGRLVEP